MFTVYIYIYIYWFAQLCQSHYVRTTQPDPAYIGRFYVSPCLSGPLYETIVPEPSVYNLYVCTTRSIPQRCHISKRFRFKVYSKSFVTENY